MSNQKYTALHTYIAVQHFLNTIANRVNSNPLHVFPGGMELTPGGSKDPAFLASWNEQILQILRNKTDVKGSTKIMEDIPMTASEGFDVLIGFLGDYEKTLMSSGQEHELLTSLRAEQKLPVEDKPTNGYWKQWLSFLSMVKT